jgi:hypothetical protein
LTDAQTEFSRIKQNLQNLRKGVLMKKIFLVITIIAIGMMFMPGTSVMAGGDKNRGEIGQGDTYENGCGDQPCFEDAPQPGNLTAMTAELSDPTAVLDETEIDHLIFIREEEKMARDVYLSLFEKWGNPVFANIAESEQAHMDAMAKLLTFYGIDDPVMSDEIGALTDPDIAELFDDLILLGSESEEKAILVGGFIEEYDILDIWKAYDETEAERIKRVYQNLYEGSYNHLNAFVYNYAVLTGTPYNPQLLSRPQFDLVMAFETQAKQAQGLKQQKGK